MLLQVMAFATDVRNHLKTIGEPHFGDFTQCRVRLFGRRSIHTGAYTAFLRAVFQRGRLALYLHVDTRLANQLIDGWHRFLSNDKTFKIPNCSGTITGPAR